MYILYFVQKLIISIIKQFISLFKAIQSRNYNLHEFLLHAYFNTDFHFISTKWNKIQQKLSCLFFKC